MIPIYVLTNDNNAWLLPGFAYLFNKHWSSAAEVTIVGFNRPAFHLPDNFSFLSLGHENLPASRWGEGVLNFLSLIRHETFLLFLEDYWLYRPVDADKIQTVYDEFERWASVLRCDLSGDRARFVDASRHEIFRIEGMPIFNSPRGAEYQMSFQAAIWSKTYLRQQIRPDENPWESEINGTRRLNEDPYAPRVWATAERLLHYDAVYRSKKKFFSVMNIPEEDVQHIHKLMGWAV